MGKIKLSVFTVATPDLTPHELAEAARDAGLDGIEWRDQDVPPEAKNAPPYFWGNNRCSIPTDWTEQQLDVFRDAAASAGMASIAVVPYLACGDIAGTKRVLEAAQRLGASFIRLGVHRYDRSRPFPELFDEQRRYLAQAETLCRQFSIKGLIELHHVTIAPSASAAYRLLEGFDPAALGALYDPGNMVFEGFENWRLGLEQLGPYLAHVHMKNAGWRMEEDGEARRWKCDWTPIDRGIVDWAQVVADLKAVGYEGYIGAEDFSGTWESKEMLNRFVKYMNTILK